MEHGEGGCIACFDVRKWKEEEGARGSTNRMNHEEATFDDNDDKHTEERRPREQAEVGGV